MQLDRDLEEAKATVPPLLQMPDISELVTDPAEQLMCRFNLDLLYMKTKIVLHRRYMLTPFEQLSDIEQQRGIGTSRKACIECALRVLGHHHTIYSASQTGGQLESVKWYMGSISTHDFLLAAMVLCLELSEQIHNRSFRFSPSGMQCPRRRAMMDALEKSHQIWSETSGRKRKNMQFVASDGLEKGEHLFDETEKASRAMAVMLDKVKRQMAETPQPLREAPAAQAQMQMLNVPGVPSYVWADQEQLRQTGFTGLIGQMSWGDMSDVPMPNSAAVVSNPPAANWQATNGTHTMSSIGTASTNGASTMPSDSNNTPDQPYDPIDFSMIGDMLDGPMNLDWEMWDNEIITRPQQDVGDWADLDLPGGAAGISIPDLRYGNAMTGGTGALPGNVFMNTGASMNWDLDLMNNDAHLGTVSGLPAQ